MMNATDKKLYDSIMAQYRKAPLGSEQRISLLRAALEIRKTSK